MPLPERGMSIEIDWSRFAMVAIGSTFTKVNCDRVGNNQFHSINTALENCRKLGYRKIGLALPKLVDDKVDHIWLAGYLAFKHLHKELSAVEPLIADRFNVNTFREWYLRNKPDVVVTTHIPILEWLSKLGFRVPDDVGYVHLDWIPERGDFAGINQNPEAVGAAAVDLLVEQVNQNRRGIPPVARSLHVEGIWRNGPTAPGLKS